MRSPAGLLFDVGGTLLREESYDLAAGLRPLVPSIPERARLVQELEEALAAAQASDHAEFRLADWLASVREIGERDAGGDESRELIFWRHAVRLVPMPGARAALAQAGARGLRLGAVSNAIFSGDVLAWELARHGFADLLAFVISSADLGVRKPDPRILRHAANRLRLDPSEIWFMGDSWGADVVGAAQCGMTPVWYSKPVRPPDPDLAHVRLESWRGLARLLGDARSIR
jgi:HAD superfamily hydrolase (TIGR01509 family)